MKNSKKQFYFIFKIFYLTKLFFCTIMQKMTLIVLGGKSLKKTLILLMFLHIMQITCAKDFSQDEFLKQNPVLQKLLYYGTLAPSTHNAQMWKIRILSDNEFLIILDKERNLNYVDPDSRESLISIGAFLANIIKGSETLGLNLQYNIYNEAAPDNSVVYVSFSEIETEFFSEPLKKFENLLLKRKTSKEKFSNKKIPVQEINKIIAEYGDSVIYLPKDSASYEYIRENTIRAYETQGRNQDKRNELSEWFRFSDEETEAKKDGLSAEMLGMSPLKKFFYYNFYNREKVKNIKFLNEELKLIKTQVNTANGFLLVIAKDNSIKENIRAGIVLENIWLNAADADVKIQPLSQILEEEPYKNNISNDLNINGEVKMILRTGYSPNNKIVKKVRRNIKDILDNTEISSTREEKQ